MPSHLLVLALLAAGTSPAPSGGDGATARTASEVAHLREVMREPDPTFKRLAAVDLADMLASIRMRDTLREIDPATRKAIDAAVADLSGRR